MSERVGELTPDLARDMGAPGATGSVYWDGQQYMVDGVPAEQEAKGEDSNDPMTPAPDLNALTIGEDEHLREVLAGIKTATQGKNIKLAPDQQATLNKLVSDTKRDQNWPSQVQKFLGSLKQNGILDPILKATGLDKTNPAATGYARSLTKKKGSGKAAKMSADQLKKHRERGFMVPGLSGSDKKPGNKFLGNEGPAAKAAARALDDVDDDELANDTLAVRGDYNKLREETAKATKTEDDGLNQGPSPSTVNKNRQQGAGAAAFMRRADQLGADLNLKPKGGDTN